VVQSHRSWILARYPDGIPVPADFELREMAVPAPAPGQVRVRVIYLSMDPAPRMRMDPKPRMGPPLPLGSVVIGRGAGIVEETASAAHKVGDLVTGELGWQEQAVLDAQALQSIARTTPLSYALGVLASSGLTAYFTLREGQARSGQTVLVSAAAGSVGLAACQIASILECRVIACAHGEEQLRFLSTRLQLDAVIDDTAPTFARALEQAAGSGIDLFLDSVGGALHDAVMERLSVAGRAILYGFISAYNAAAGTEPQYGRLYQVIKRRAHLQGFLLGDHAAAFPQALEQLTHWIRAGKLRSFEAITEGFEYVPEAFARLFGEATPGKHLVRISPDPTISPQEKETIP